MGSVVFGKDVFSYFLYVHALCNTVCFYIEHFLIKKPVAFGQTQLSQCMDIPLVKPHIVPCNKIQVEHLLMIKINVCALRFMPNDVF